MNYFNTLSLFLFTALASFAHANDSYSSNFYHSEPVYGSLVCPEPTCCWTDGLSFSADGLYYKGYEDNLQYAAVYNYATDSSIPNVSLSSGNSQYKSPTFKDNFGYRLRLNYENPCECLGYAVTYFHYHTTARGHVAAPQTSFSSPISSSSSGVSLLYSNSNGGQGIIDFCGARLRLNIDMIDFDIGRTFCWNCVNFRPFIGVRYAEINQKYKINASGNDAGTRENGTLSYRSICLLNDFEGVGLHAGLDLNWNVGCGFGIYGNCAGSLLYGHTHMVSQGDFYESDFEGGTLTRSATHLNSRQHGPRAILEAEIGVNWTYSLLDTTLVRLKLGWSNLLFLNSNRFDNSVAIEKSQVFSLTRHGDLGLQGLVFGGEISF